MVGRQWEGEKVVVFLMFHSFFVLEKEDYGFKTATRTTTRGCKIPMVACRVGLFTNNKTREKMRHTPGFLAFFGGRITP